MVRLVERLFRWLMCLYPPRFRRAHGLAMFELFRDEARAGHARAGGAGACLVLLRGAGDVVRNAPAAWLGKRSQAGAAIAPHEAGGDRHDRSSGIWNDMRVGLRHLRQAPAFSLVAVGTLALGIGANTAVFSIVNAVLFRPLAARDSDRVVRISIGAASRGGGPRRFSYADYVDYRARATTLHDVCAVNLAAFVLSADNRSDQILGEIVSGRYMALLGARAAAGRLLLESDDAPAADPVAVISDALWRRRFGREPVTGRSVLLNGAAYTIVGVADASVVGSFVGAPVDVWVPIEASGQALGPNWRTDRSVRPLGLMARLADGASAPRAAGELRAIAAALARETHQSAEPVVGIEPGTLATADQRRAATPLLLSLSGLVLLVLVVACANVGNLLLSRVVGRKRELAIRLSLGASRARVARMLAIEGLFIALVGGAFALALASWTTRALNSVSLLPGLALRLDAGPDARVAAFTAAAAVFAAIVLALVGTLQVVRRDLAPALKTDGPASVGARGGARLRGVLVAAQIAVSLLLVIGAALFARGAQAAASIDPGFDPRGVVALDLDGAGGRTAAESLQLFRRVLDDVGRLPSVESAALSTRAPLDASTPLVRVSPGQPVEPQDRESPTVSYLVVGGRFFDVVRTPLAAGRAFGADDDEARPGVVIVNEALASKLWPAGDAIGHRLWLDPQVAPAPCTVVGIARNSKYLSLSDDHQGHVYLPFAQHPRRGMTLLVRSVDPPDRTIAHVREVLRAVDPTLEGFFARTLIDHVGVSTLPVRLAAKLAGAVAALALALAVVGLYSLVSFIVTDRTQEIGLRMALGASSRTVMRQVVASGIRLTLAGLCIGIPAAVAGTRVLRTLLYGVSPTDPLTFVGATLLLVCVSVAACAIPALRAMRLSPIIALGRR